MANNNITATTHNSSIANLGTVRHSALNTQEDLFAFLKENIRVVEYTNETGSKIENVQLQFRAGPGYVWEEVRRVKLKLTDKPF
jgi:hypothetical protein